MAIFRRRGQTANIRLEAGVEMNTLGDNFEKTRKGFIDFCCWTTGDFRSSFWKPSQKRSSHWRARNRRGNTPAHRTVASSSSPTETSTTSGTSTEAIPISSRIPNAGFSHRLPEDCANPQRLVDERVSDDYIVLTQRPNYASEAAWKNEAERPGLHQRQQTALPPSISTASRPRPATRREGRQRSLPI